MKGTRVGEPERGTDLVDAEAAVAQPVDREVAAKSVLDALEAGAFDFEASAQRGRRGIISAAMSSNTGQGSALRQPRRRRRSRAVQLSSFLYFRKTDCGAVRRNERKLVAFCTVGTDNAPASKRRLVNGASKATCCEYITVYSRACSGRG